MAQITTTIPYVDMPVAADGETAFITKANALPPQFQALTDDSQDFATEANALRDEVNGFQVTASAAAVAAANAQASAEGFRDEAEGFRDEAAAIAGALPEGSINDSVTTLTDTWSSQKIASEISSSPAGLVPLQTVSFSSVSAIEITDLDTLGYDNFKILLEVDATSAFSQANMRFSSDNGTTFRDGASEYVWVQTITGTGGGGVSVVEDQSDSRIYFSGFGQYQKTIVEMNLNGFLDSSEGSRVDSRSSILSSATGLGFRESAGTSLSSALDNAIQIYAATAEAISGKYTLYGVAEA